MLAASVQITSSPLLWALRSSVSLTALAPSSAVGTMRGVFLYGGSVTANQIVVMAQMNLRPAQPVIAPSASSSVRTATVPILASSVMATQTALMVQMRALLSAVTTDARKTSSSVKTRSVSLCPGTATGQTTVQMAATRTQTFVARGPADRDSSSVPTGAVCHQAMYVTPRTTVEMDQMNHLKPAWVQTTSAMRTLSSLARQTTAVFLSGPDVTAPMTASTTATSKAVRR